jgi:hypothetical protein
MSTQIAAITIAQMALLGLVVWLVAVRLQDRARHRLELQARMLERFSSPAELKEFLESDGGRRLMGSLSPRLTVAPRLLLTVQAGVVVTLVGFGLMMTDQHDLLPAGIMVVMLGLGLLASAVVSWALARFWGLMPDARTARDGH